MFKVFDRWRHQNCIDVDIVIKKMLFSDETGTSCLVAWINQRSDFIHHPLDRIFINAKSYKHWKKIDSYKHELQ
jgi:hypothetical protein